MNTDQARRDHINVAITIDRNYTQAAGVMLNSLLVNTASDVHVYLLHSNLEQQQIALFDALIAQHDHAAIDYHQLESKEIERFPAAGHLKSVAYGYFLLPELLPETEEKILYLDPDVIVLSDVQELWNVDVENVLLAAVPVISPPCDKILSAGDDFFNSGVILINLKMWRECGLMNKALKAASDLADHIRGADQDVINVVSRNHWKKLPLRWNKRPNFYLKKDNAIYSADEIEEAGQNTGIIHFTGPVKPWHYACFHPEQKQYLNYKKNTPWESVPLDGKNIISFFSRMLPLRIANIVGRHLAHSDMGTAMKRIMFTPRTRSNTKNGSFGL